MNTLGLCHWPEDIVLEKFCKKNPSALNLKRTLQMQTGLKTETTHISIYRFCSLFVCSINIWATEVRLFVLSIFEQQKYVCLFYQYLSNRSTFVCSINIWATEVRLFVLSIFEQQKYVCLFYQYLSNRSTFVCSINIWATEVRLFVLSIFEQQKYLFCFELELLTGQSSWFTLYQWRPEKGQLMM